MPGAGRLRDVSRCTPHGAEGPSVTCSEDVIINDRGALRVGDRGVYPCPCAAWQAVAGAPGVYVNGRRLHRLGDADDKGELASASDDATVGDQAAAQGKRPPETWVAFTLLTPGTRMPLAHVPVKVTHAGKEYLGETDEVGQFLVDGLPLEPREATIEIMDWRKEVFDVPPAERDPEDEAHTTQPDEYASLADAGAAPPAPPPERPEVQRARGEAFLARGDAGAAAASLREAMAGYVRRGDRDAADDVQRILGRITAPAAG